MAKTIKTWKDETGSDIPVKRISQYEKDREKAATKLLKKALEVESVIAKFHREVNDQCQEMFLQFIKEFDIAKSDRKGNHTFYSFDRSIKIVTKMSDLITFDDELIQASQAKLDEFIGMAIEKTDDFVKVIIKDAFNNTRGQLDTRKVLGLLKHRQTVRNPLFLEAMDLLEKSIRRPSTKSYFQIFRKDEKGEYKAVNLNFSNL